MNMAENVAHERSQFRFFRAETPLDAYVDHLYASDVPKPFTDHVIATRVPELEAQLVFAIEEGKSFPGAKWFADGFSASLFLQPAHVNAIPIPGTIRAAVGASLRPAGLRLLLRRGAGDLSSEPLIPLEDLCGFEARVLSDQLVGARGSIERVALLKAYLERRAEHAGRVHPSALHAVDLLSAAQGAASVEAVAQRCGVTSRTLRNVLLSETGLSPKHLARVIRVRRALDLLRTGGSLAGAEVNEAFADRAHLCREFRALLGTTPATLVREMRDAPRRLPDFTTERDLLKTGLLLRSAP